MERGALKWEARLNRFSKLREGGPGRPLTLLAVAAAIIATGYAGFRLQEVEGISSAGPALILLSVWSSLSLALWILVKAVLRDLDVVFVADVKGLTIRPSKRQDRLDRRMGWIARLAFLLSWKGGQWARWFQATRATCPPSATSSRRRRSTPCWLTSACRRLFLRMLAPHVGFASGCAITMIAKEALARAGINGYAHHGAHLFRHSLATDLLRSGASFAEIGQLLRHRSIDSTRIYAKLDIEKLRKLSLSWPGGVQ